MEDKNLEREAMLRYAAQEKRKLDDGSKADFSRVKEPFWKRSPLRRER